ncbi:MAG: PilZ domain-containing protein [Spongiibacteraceae bacterium]
MLRDWLKRQRQKQTVAAVEPAAESVAAAHSPDLGALREVYLNLFDVQRSHALIDVAIDGTDARYQSIIIGVDPERGVVEIDELFPAGFIGLPGQPLTVTVRLDGKRRLTFNTHVISRRDDGQIESYWLALPESLDYNQRRGSFRLQLGQGWGVISEFLAPDQERCSARVRDLSSTGIRLEVLGGTKPTTGDVLHDLHFEFAGRNYQCAADVRNVTNLSGKSDGLDRFLVGAQFRDMSRVEQRSLERMIMQMQRQHVQQAIA